jgi:hypothetical protein
LLVLDDGRLVLYLAPTGQVVHMWSRNQYFYPTGYETSWFSWCVHRKSLEFRREWEGVVLSWLQFIVTVLLAFGTECCMNVANGGWDYCTSVFDVAISLSLYYFRIKACLCINIWVNYLGAAAHVSAAPRVVCMCCSCALRYFEQILKCLSILLVLLRLNLIRLHDIITCAIHVWYWKLCTWLYYEHGETVQHLCTRYVFAHQIWVSSIFGWVGLADLVIEYQHQ